MDGGRAREPVIRLTGVSKVYAIGDQRLKALDDVAYVRFASVYRKFTDVGTFMDELQKLVDEKM